MKILNQSQNSINFERRKVPRYIYHLTNEEKYNSMLRDGFIKTFDKDPYTNSNALFTIDLKNFIKFWGKHKDWDAGNGKTLRYDLLRAAVRWYNTLFTGTNNLVILRIPTDKLDKDKLAIRSQNVFFKYNLGKTKPLASLGKSFKNNLYGKTQAFSQEGKKLHKKEACEYIYYENIPISDVQQIGKIVNIPEIKKSEPEKFNTSPVKMILSEALEGTPERKWSEFIKD